MLSEMVRLEDLAVVESTATPRLFHAVADPERGGPTVCGLTCEGVMEPLMRRRLCRLCHAKLKAAGRIVQ